MIEFQLPDMTCGPCASGVTQAPKPTDPGCRASVDLKAQTVQVQSTDCHRSRLAVVRGGGLTLSLWQA